MFSKSCEYALRAMIFVSQGSGSGKKVGLQEMSADLQIPPAFLAKILQQLVRKGLLHSHKGPGGGFFIDEDIKRKNLAELVQAIDGNGLFKNCAMGMKICTASKPCPLHNDFQSIRKDIYQRLRAARISDFNEAISLGTVFLSREKKLC